MSCISPKAAAVAADFRMLEPGLHLKVTCTDPDYLLIEVVASNGRFTGLSRVYGGVDDFDELASLLEGFPKSSGDHRSYEFGKPGYSTAGGYVKLTFRTVDSVGHSVVEIAIEDDASFRSSDRAEFTSNVEAFAIDTFVERLRLVHVRKVEEATLVFTTPPN
jgi:hypothetical protein